MSSTLKLHKIDYRKLNGRQQENYNFQKISGLLADYGFTTIRLSDDWNGADFLAQHVDGKTVLRVQLKGRLGIYKNITKKSFGSASGTVSVKALSGIFIRMTWCSAICWRRQRSSVLPHGANGEDGIIRAFRSEWRCT